MVDEIERLPEQNASQDRRGDTARLQKKVNDGLAAEQRLDDGGVAPWEVSQLRRIASEGRNAQSALRRRGHETSLPEEAAPDD